MKKLPGIYHNNINKDISNNQDVFYVSKEMPELNVNSGFDVEGFIDSLLKEEGYVFNKPLLITTKDKVYDTAIVKKEKTKIFTLTDDIIDINDITNIKRTK